MMSSNSLERVHQLYRHFQDLIEYVTYDESLQVRKGNFLKQWGSDPTARMRR